MAKGNRHMRLRLVRRFSAVLLFVTAALSVLALVAFVLLAILIFQGRVGTKLLYSIAVDACVGGFALSPILIGAASNPVAAE